MLPFEHSRFIPKSCSVGSPCRIIYTACGFTALPAFALNRLSQFGETATATDGAYYAWVLLTDT
ncbi:MAG: hypothetical protein J6T41_01120 [Neisseriaceae bacterium]|nr:hypothetical protein [Neisseriaceae bacterium]